MTALYSLTLFTAAFLVFAIQPLAGKALLPWFGGSPDVWNACMMFFQGMLLIGYIYAHLLSRRLSPRAQAAIHLVVLTLATVAATMAPAPPPDPVAVSEHPVRWILTTLTRWLGLPYFVLASTSPLLQQWFAASRHRRARDPYFLYAASNLGSLGALLAYPLVFEPWLPLSRQHVWWAAGYAELLVLTLVVVFQSQGPARLAPSSAAANPRGRARTRVSWKKRARWLALAFVPSSLLLGVTTYLTTDIAPMPLLWVVPLALYLLSFIFALDVGPRLGRSLSRATGFLGLLVILTMFRAVVYPDLIVALLHLAFFGVAALSCHSRLMQERPEAGALTEFYLFLAIGGALGGIANSLVAPLVFNNVYEYPLAIVAICAMRPGIGARGRIGPDLTYAALTALLSICLGRVTILNPTVSGPVFGFLTVGLVAVLALRALERPRRFVLTVVGIHLVAHFFPTDQRATITSLRSFFGTVQVVDDRARDATLLLHGRTVHGVQAHDPAGRLEPRSYYHRGGPAGDIFAGLPRPARVGLVGLGAGSLAAYAAPQDHWTFYELNPDVITIARNPDYFTFLRDSRAGQLDIRLGDARLLLGREPPGTFDLLLLDAFGSDAIPVHLMTRESFAIYLSRLKPGGLLAMHISSRYLDLSRAIGWLAADAHATAYLRTVIVPTVPVSMNLSTSWVVIARDAAALEAFARDPRWTRLEANASGAWTDDYFNVLGLLK